MKTEYLIVLTVSFAAPIILSLSRKLDFYKYPARLILSLAIPFALFAVWDVIAVSRGHWSFNSNYVTGFRIFNLPIEEILFFIVIPFCGIFTWESVKYFTSGSGEHGKK